MAAVEASDPATKLALVFNDAIKEHFRDRGGDVSVLEVTLAACAILSSYIGAIEDDAGKADYIAWIGETLLDQAFGATH